MAAAAADPQSADDPSPPIDIKHQCICSWENTSNLLSCRDLRQRHVYGSATHRLPTEPAKAREFMAQMEVPRENWDGYIDCNNADDGQEVRYAHIHHRPDDRRLTASGRAAVISGKTNFGDDKWRLPAFGNPPLPSRPRSGQFGVDNSPNKHGTPAAAAAEAARRDAAARTMQSLGQNEEDEEEGSQEPAAAAKPSGFRAGTGLATIEQVILLAKTVEAHAHQCAGTIHWSTRDSTFVGVAMSLGGHCRECHKTLRWYSSPAATDTANAHIADPDNNDLAEGETTQGGGSPWPPASDLYLNQLVPFALATSPGITEQQLCFMEALELSVPNRSALFKQMHTDVADAVEETWKDEQRELIGIAAAQHDGKMMLAVDGSHTGSADGAGTLSTVNAIDLFQNKVVWSECSNTGGPSGREHALGIKLLEWVRENDIDVPAIAIDESSLQAVIKATVRSAAVTDSMSEAECMEVIIDLVGSCAHLTRCSVCRCAIIANSDDSNRSHSGMTRRT